MAMYWSVFALCGLSNIPLFCAVIAIGTKVYSFILSPLLALLFYLLKAFINLFFKRIACSYIASALYLLSSILNMLVLFVPEIYYSVVPNFTSGLSLLLSLGVALVLLWQCLRNPEFLDDTPYP